MRIDHIAYRVKDRHKTANFFMEVLHYKLAEGKGLVNGGFNLKFPDGSTTDCLVLEPPEKVTNALWSHVEFPNGHANHLDKPVTYHLAPEIFISDGEPGSIVGDWVAARGNIGGIHHIAYQVESVANTMEKWKEAGYAEFCSDKPMVCPGLTQIFTKPSELTGVIYELIEREDQGFCKENVIDLMSSTKGI